jgi:hypothetical protein
VNNPTPTPGGPPLRALAMVLIALAIVFAGLGAMSLSNSGADAAEGAEQTETTTSSVLAQAPVTTVAPPTTSADEDTDSTETSTPTTTESTSTVDHSVSVRVLNNSLIIGLAASTATELTSAGWTNVSTGNYEGTNLTTTTVFYGAGDKAAATAIAAEVGGTVAPKSGDTAPGIVVVLTGR